MKKLVFLCPLFLFLFGCTLEPRYEPPCVDRPEAWKNGQDGAGASPVCNWWDVFEDEKLAELIAQAIENNQDLIAAQERIEQARDIALIRRGKLFPELDVDPSFSNATVLTQIYGPGLPHYPFVLREHQMEYSIPFNLSYEVDLWGKIRSSYKEARLTTEARQEAYNGLKLMLTTELANAYFQLRLLDAEIELYGRIVGTRVKFLELNRARFEGELIDYSAVAMAEQQLDFAEKDADELKENRARFENMIAVLIGVPASEFHLESMPLVAPPPQIPAGVPCDMLMRRPDLAEMEREVASIHARLGVVYADYLPTVDLAGTLGFLSPLIKDFLKNISRLWSIGVNLSEVIFNGLARYYNVQLTWAQYREAVARYRQGVLNAFQELENALSNLNWIERQMQSTGKAVQAAKVDLSLTRDRFEQGVGSYLPVTNKEEVALQNEQMYLILTSRSYLNTVQLIRAMGGSW